MRNRLASKLAVSFFSTINFTCKPGCSKYDGQGMFYTEKKALSRSAFLTNQILMRPGSYFSNLADMAAVGSTSYMAGKE